MLSYKKRGTTGLTVANKLVFLYQPVLTDRCLYLTQLLQLNELSQQKTTLTTAAKSQENKRQLSNHIPFSVITVT